MLQQHLYMKYLLPCSAVLTLTLHNTNHSRII
jgi:hypothetical protein